MPNKTQTGTLETTSQSHTTPEVKNQRHEGFEQESVITMMATAEAIYNFWRNLKNLPLFMKRLESIEIKSVTESHWKWRALRGHLPVEWTSEIIKDIPHSLIAWRSIEGSAVDHAGEVSFRELPHRRGTEVRVLLNYRPLGGAVTNFLEKVLGDSPQKNLQDDLRRLRELIEVGVIPTTEGQPRGGMDETINPHIHTQH